MPLPAITATRYQLVVARRCVRSYGLANEFLSLQLFERSVTESAITAVATWGSPKPAALAFQLPWMYTGFSETTVKPGEMMLPSAPLTSLSARRKKTGGLRRAIACPSAVLVASAVVWGVMACTYGALIVAHADAGPPTGLYGSRAVAPYTSSAPLPLTSSPTSSTPFGVPEADSGLTLSSNPYSAVSAFAALRLPRRSEK